MKVCMQERNGFLMGLVAGMCVGAGLALWLVPKAAAEVRGRLRHSADALGERVDDTVEKVTDRVNAVRDDLADVVVRGARKVEHIAKAAKA